MTDEDAWACPLPNLRAHFLPDPDYVFVEADLARADAQVIAWEAGAVKLKHQLTADEDIHADNAQLLYGHVFDSGRPRQVRTIEPRSMHSNGMSYRDNAKRWVHLTNFAGGANTGASTIVAHRDHVEACQRWWLTHEHPEVGELHKRIDWELRSRKNPVIRNVFGFRRAYVGGDRQSNLLGQALAWIAQSTTACVCNHALLRVDCGLDLFGQPRCGSCLVCDIPEAQLLLQVHDSLLLQVPQRLFCAAFVERFKEAMAVVCPYEDPLIIGSDVKFSARSWGHMEKWK